MAILHYSFIKFFFCSSLLVVFVSCFVEESHASESRKLVNSEGHFHTLEISSLLPASVCSHSTGSSSETQSTMNVFHRHGPCSTHPQQTPTTTPPLSDLLSYDQSRVQSIQARLNPNSNTNKINPNRNRIIDKKANLPVQPGASLGSGNYLVTVGLGTPAKTFSLMFDTGSDLTWTQCEPCARSCYAQKEPIFDPSTSSSYSNISCSSSQCSQLKSATGNDPGCSSTTCVYGIQYGDQSFSVGFFSKDKLTVSSTDVFPNFMFGCGQNNQGLFGKTAGLLGLGRDPLSLVSQTAGKYGKYFSYCLPSTSSSTGHLTLGKGGASNNVKFAPFASSQGTSFYFIEITSIYIGGQQLTISQTIFKNSGTIIDSGTVITRLPPTAYSTLSSAFKQRMKKYPSAPAYSLLDTCFDFSNYTSITIPTVSLAISGVKIDLPSSAILVAIDGTKACLAFAANGDDTDVAILGNTQQKTFEVVYDIAGGKIGFGAGGCK